MPKQFLIMKTGNTVRALLQQGEDFEDWIIGATGLAVEKFITVAVDQDEPLPLLEQISALIITGSPAFITDNAPWNEVAINYVKQAHDAAIPILGICYGHQLLAQAFGGTVGFHPRGREIGTVQIKTTAMAMDDVLLASLGQAFSAQASHLQSVIRLPPDAVLLAANQFEPHHGFRLGNTSWGIQFHPEFTAATMKAYLDERWQNLAGEGLDPERLKRQVRECKAATSLLRRFAELVAGERSIQDAVSSLRASS